MAKCVLASDLGSQADTYFFALAYNAEKATFATIGSDNTLRLFNSRLNLQRAAAQCHTGADPLQSGVDCLQAGGSAHFVTGGRDGVVRCWDARARGVAQTADPRGNGIAALACHGNQIAVGTESLKEGLGDVSVLVYDTRNLATPSRQYLESHTDTITRLAFHPTYPHVLLSASTDGLVSIFDINHVEEEDALQQVLNPRSAVHCAGFIAEDQVYVVSTDEQYSIHTLAKTSAEDEEVPPPILFGDVRESLRCMYVVDVLSQTNGPPLMAYGNSEEQTLSLVSLGSPGAWRFGRKLDLPGGHGDEIVRDIILVDQLAYSCGEDGKVRAWSLG